MVNGVRRRGPVYRTREEAERSLCLYLAGGNVFEPPRRKYRCGVCGSEDHTRAGHGRGVGDDADTANIVDAIQKRTGGVDDQTSRTLVLVNRDWALRVARSFCRNFPGLDDADIVSDALFALVGVARRFRSSLGVPFQGYAYKRIIGAMRGLIDRELYRGANEAYRLRRVRRDVYDLDEIGTLVPLSTRPSQELTADLRKAWEFIGRLEPAVAAALTRYFFADEDVGVIADELGSSEFDVWQSIQDGRRQLSEWRAGPAEKEVRKKSSPRN